MSPSFFNRFTPLPLAGLALLMASSAFAQSAPADDPVVVTALRLPQPLSTTPDAYVITAADIDRRQAAFVTDLLVTVPGAAVYDSGYGGVASLSLRGASADKTLVLIDGVPVNDPTQPAGGFDVSSLAAADVSRIEVLSGPQGALWGSDAIGGVVSITTAEPHGVTGAIEGGSLDTWREAASVGVSTAGYAAGLAATGFRSDGVPNADEKYGNTKPDGFNQASLALNGRVQLPDNVTLEARARYSQAYEEYEIFDDPTQVEDPNARSQTHQGSGFVRAAVSNLFGFDQELRIDLMSIERDYFGLFPFSARGDQEVLRWTATRQEKLWGLEVGLEHKRAEENTGDGMEARSADGAFAIGRVSPVDWFTTTVSLRRDDPQGYQGQTTGRIAGALKLGGGFSLLASAGQGYKAPSIFETDYPCPECATPGPAVGLKPERAEGADAALAWTSGDGRITARATAYTLRVRDQIDYLYPLGYLNIESVKSQGAEFSGEAQLVHGFSLRGSYAYTDARDGTTNAQLLRIPRDSGSGSLSWRGGAWQAEFGAHGQDQAPDVAGEIRPYGVAYANVAYRLTPHLTLTGRAENLTNSHYEQTFGYGEPGRMLLVGLRWR